MKFYARFIIIIYFFLLFLLDGHTIIAFTCSGWKSKHLT